jgi:hypothetical protein
MLAPAVVGVRPDAMHRDDAARDVSMALGDGVLLQRTYSMISIPSAGASRSTLRPMSSSVIGRTWFRVSLGALPPARDPPLLC